MNNNGLISRQTAIDKLFEYAESKFQSGEIELANGILKQNAFWRAHAIFQQPITWIRF